MHPLSLQHLSPSSRRTLAKCGLGLLKRFEMSGRLGLESQSFLCAEAAARTPVQAVVQAEFAKRMQREDGSPQDDAARPR